MSKTDFQNGFALGMVSGGVVESGGITPDDIVQEIDLEKTYKDTDIFSANAIINNLINILLSGEYAELVSNKVNEIDPERHSTTNYTTENAVIDFGEAIIELHRQEVNEQIEELRSEIGGSSGGASGDKWTIVEQTFTHEGGESGTSGAFSLTPKTPKVTEFTEAYLWATLSSTSSGSHRINFSSDRVQIVSSQQIGTTPTRLAVHVIKIGDTLYAQKVNDTSIKTTHNGFSDSITLNLNTHWSTIGANEVITSVGGVMYR